MAETNHLAVTAKDLTKQFDHFTAVDNISFNVKRGEIFGFLGPNGSGKTTTIRMMLGLLKPTDGEVEVLGTNVVENPERIRPRVGYMSQRFSLYNDLSVLQNLRFYGKAYGLGNRLLDERIEEAIARAGLEGRQNNQTRDLSGGWRQRLALAASILHRPELVFLDEPTAGVDPISRREFWELLYHLVTQGVTVFVTTHYMDEAEHCHRLAFIQRGRIIAMGSPKEIKEEMMRGTVLEVQPDDASRAVKLLQDAQKNMENDGMNFGDVAMYGSLVHVILPGHSQKKHKKAAKAIKKFLKQADVSVLSITEIEPSLEDVFIKSMSSSESEGVKPGNPG
jgi:ABC-2 type transport system ATP-binding protein